MLSTRWSRYLRFALSANQPRVKGPIPRRPRRSRGRPLYLEPLEDRTVLDVGDTLRAAALTGWGPAAGSFSRPDERLGGNDVDLYQFHAAPGTGLLAQTSNPVLADDKALNPVLRLFDASGTQLAVGTNGGSGNYVLLEHHFTTAGTYYIGISGSENSFYNPRVGGSGTDSDLDPSYRLDVTLTPPWDVAGDTLGTALTTYQGPGPFNFRVDQGRLGDGRFLSRDVDLYRFQAGAGLALTVTTGAAGARPVGSTSLRLFDANGKELPEDGDAGRYARLESIFTGGTYYGGAGRYARLEYIFTTGGTYYVGVSGFGNDTYDSGTGGTGSRGATGTYRLDLSLAGPEVGDTLATARDTGQGPRPFTYSIADQRLGDGLSANRDVDLYRFQAAAGLAFRAETAAAGTQPAGDTFLRLFDANGRELASNDDGGTGSYSLLEYTFEASGTYYVGVSGYANRSYDLRNGSGLVEGRTGAYRLDLTLASREPDGPGDTLAEAQATGLGPGVFTRTVANQRLGDGRFLSQDVDLYRFQAAAGLALQAETAAAGTRPVEDTILRLFDADGKELALDDDGGGDLYSLLRYTFTADGTYYVGVSGFENDSYNPRTGTGRVAGEIGTYRLQLTLAVATQDVAQDAPGDTLTTAQATGLGPGVFTLTVADQRLGDGQFSSRDVDLYRFQAAAGSVLRAETAAAGDDPVEDTILRLFDADGTQLDLNDDVSDDDFYSLLQYTFTTGGTYYVGVSGFDNDSYNPRTGAGRVAGETGTYRLQLTLNRLLISPDGPGDTLNSALDTGSGPGVFTLTVADQRLGDGQFSSRDVDLYRFQAAAGSELRAETAAAGDSPVEDTILRLFDADGTQLDLNDDVSDDDLYSLLQYTFATAGTYYVGVSGYDNGAYNPRTGARQVAGETGTYRLQLTLAVATQDVAQDTPGDTLTTAQATGLGPGVFTEDQRLGDGQFLSQDVDLYRLQAAAGLALQAETAAAGTRPVEDTILRLFDADGRELALDDDGGDDLYSLLRYTFTADGTYYVGVSGYDNDAYDPRTGAGRVAGETGTYRLQLTLTLASPDGPGDTLAAALDTVLGPVPLSIMDQRLGDGQFSSQDVDLYRFQAAAGSELRAETAASGAQSVGDTFLRLFDADGTQLALDDDSGADLYSRLVYIFPTGGTYYVGVSGYANRSYDPRSGSGRAAGRTGIYRLDLTLTPSDGPGDTLATALDTGQGPGNFTFSLTDQRLCDGLYGERDVDLYRFQVSAGLVLRAETFAAGTHPVGDTILRLFDANGRQLALDDESGPEAYARLSYRFWTSGVYYIGVSGFDNTSYNPGAGGRGVPGATGSYRLDLTLMPPAPDLVSTSFSVVESSALWGEIVTVRYALANQGSSITEPFTVGLYLSPDAEITAADVLLTAFPGVLAAGAARTGTLRAVLPGTPLHPPASFRESGTVFLGFLFVGERRRPGEVPTRNANGGTGLDQAPLTIGAVESEPNNSMPQAQALPGAGRLAKIQGSLNRDDVDLFRIPVPESGRLTVRVHAEGVDTRLSLLDPTGRLLIQSEGQSAHRREALLDQQLRPTAAGTSYYLKVEAVRGGSGRYTLTPEFRAASPAFEDLSVRGSSPEAIVSEDFNGDGHRDLASANTGSNTVTVLLGRGDGSFDVQQPLAVGQSPAALVVADFNGDGRPDLATANRDANSVSVLLGRGEGSFQSARQFPVGNRPLALLTADLNRDGRPDLATANRDASSISVLLGRGDGSFMGQVSAPAADEPVKLVSPENLVAGDFNRDGRPDLATTHRDTNSVSVLLGQGDGKFRVHSSVGIGVHPQALVVGDFNDDGRPDLATANAEANSVSVLLGQGDGSFRVHSSVGVGSNPQALVVADFNDDRRLDLASVNQDTNNVSVLLGQGDGTFQVQAPLVAGSVPVALASGDFNSDGRPDLATANLASATVSLLLSQQDGSFRAPPATGSDPVAFVLKDFDRDHRPDIAAVNATSASVSIWLAQDHGGFQVHGPQPVGRGPVDLVTADFNGDGRLDLATANAAANSLSVLLGRGDGSFQTAVEQTVGLTPVALVTADFNRDGHFDLAVANEGSDSVWVLLGRRDGSFHVRGTFAVGSGPVQLLTEDFNRDGYPDLATANAAANSVSVLLGHGDGWFRVQPALAVGERPVALVLEDFNGDGQRDLATANAAANSVSVLLGHGDGSFDPQRSFAVGRFPVGLAAGDFNRDGLSDLAVANELSNQVSVLLGRPDGFLQVRQHPLPVGQRPVTIVAGFYNDDTHLDLAVANAAGASVSVLLGQGTGSFQVESRQPPVGAGPVALLTEDFNGDGRPDLVSANVLANNVTTLVGRRDGTFLDLSTTATTVRATPLVANLDLDPKGTLDVVVLARDGRIHYRAGGASSAIDLKNTPARDVTLVQTASGWLLGAIDATGSALSFYRPQGGPAIRRLSLPDNLPVRITAGDLNGDGRDDLAVLSARPSQVFVFWQNPDGSFALGPPPAGVGAGPAEITVGDVNGDQLRDILVTNRFSGDVSVLLNHAQTPFARALRFRAGTGVSGLEQREGTWVVRSLEQPIGSALGDFDSDGVPDLVVTNSGSNSFSLLRGTGSGGFLNPDPTHTFATGRTPTVVVAGRFNRDPYLDLAILNEGSREIQVFFGNGAGAFTQRRFAPDPGHAPTGLSARDVDGRNGLDLLVGNEFGDELRLLNDGQGTFQPEQSGNSFTLRVADLNDDGRDDFVTVNESRSRVDIRVSQRDPTEKNRDDGVLAAERAVVVDLNHDGLLDLVVPNKHGNNILVYLGTDDGTFGEEVNQGRGFFAGTRPVHVTAAYLKDELPPVPLANFGRAPGDPNLDLVVANEGSDDVTVLLGRGRGATWTLEPGPRLDTGGNRPVATVVQDVTGPRGVPDGIPDIVVSNQGSDLDGLPNRVVRNQESGRLSVLTGVGRGFFNDRNPLKRDVPDPTLVFALPSSPQAPQPLAVLSPSTGQVFVFSNFTNDPRPVGLPVGAGPIAAVVGPDFNRDGRGDLVVGNNGDGKISLVLLEAEGFRVLQAATSNLRLTDLALSLRERPPGSGVYVIGEGAESARFVEFFQETTGRPTPDQRTGGPDPSGGGSGGTGPDPRLIPGLLPLRDATLAIVATLLTGRVDESLAEADKQNTSPEAETEQSGTDEEVPGPEDPQTETIDSARARWMEFVMGLDETFAAWLALEEEDSTRPPADPEVDEAPVPTPMEPKPESPAPDQAPPVQLLPTEDWNGQPTSGERCPDVQRQDTGLLDLLAVALLAAGGYHTSSRRPGGPANEKPARRSFFGGIRSHMRNLLALFQADGTL